MKVRSCHSVSRKITTRYPLIRTIFPASALKSVRDYGFRRARWRRPSLNISEMSLDRLRKALRENRVSFPAQVPTFHGQKRADIQWRVAELFFVHQWSCTRLAPRYGLCPGYIRLIISHWVRRAAVLGYVQEIPPAPACIEENAVSAKSRPAKLDTSSSAPSSLFQLNDVMIDLYNRTITAAGDNIRLTRSEWTVLETLASKANRTVPHSELLNLLSSPRPPYGVHRLRHLIGHLRRKLEPVPASPRFLITEPAVGYRLNIPHSLPTRHDFQVESADDPFSQ
jgi:DNA-binding winged helix-turn-helix (wHTH) protein